MWLQLHSTGLFVKNITTIFTTNHIDMCPTNTYRILLKLTLKLHVNLSQTLLEQIKVGGRDHQWPIKVTSRNVHRHNYSKLGLRQQHLFLANPKTAICNLRKKHFFLFMGAIYYYKFQVMRNCIGLRKIGEHLNHFMCNKRVQ